MKRIIAVISLYIMASVISGCVLLPLAPFAGTAYGGFETWRGNKAIKYYASDLDTVYLAVKQSCEQMKLETKIHDPVPQKEYSLDILGNHPALIKILLVEKNVTKVVIGIGFSGDKQYAEFFFKAIDDHVSKIVTNELKQE
ncbi:MAG: DUF3568 family protein [Smithellaceae bacterium]